MCMMSASICSPTSIRAVDRITAARGTSTSTIFMLTTIAAILLHTLRPSPPERRTLSSATASSTTLHPAAPLWFFSPGGDTPKLGYLWQRFLLGHGRNGWRWRWHGGSLRREYDRHGLHRE